MSRLATLAIASLLATVALPSLAQAQDPYQPHASSDRDGLMIGFGIGGGEAQCSGEACNGVTEAGSIDAHVGTMIRPRLAIMGDAWVMMHTEDRLTLTHGIFTVAAQLWVTDRLWVKGGLGGARASYRYDGVLVNATDRTETVPGVMAAVGVELIRSKTFALDAQLKGGTGFYDDDTTRVHNAAVSIGFNWY
jgi:hypothetical protein